MMVNNISGVRIILLPGMSPNDGIFQQLKTKLPPAEFMEWIPQEGNESIADYARRLDYAIPKTDEKVMVCGISFGGVVARELAAIMNAKACILISSIADVHQLPPLYRFFSKIPARGLVRIFRAIGFTASCFPRRVRTKSIARLTKFNGAEGSWYCWATAAVLRWKISEGAMEVPVTQIHGDRDRTFPIRHLHKEVDHKIAGGCHLIPLTRSGEVSAILKEIAENL